MDFFGIIKQFCTSITIDDVLCVAGLILLGIWLLKTSWGRNALANSRPRRNNMPLYLPFIPLFIWFGAPPLAISIITELVGNLQGWQGAFLDNLVLSVGAIAVIAVIIFLARASFARRLKGFGLNVKTIHKDFLAAFVNLLAVWPLVLAAIISTIFFGRLIYGQDFQMQPHEELELITAYPQLPLQILIVVLAVVIAPLLEELLFRGFFQTMIRSILERRNPNFGNPNGASPASSCRLLPRLASKDAEARKTGAGAWLSILISSALFAMIHTNAGHWPALFVLAVCLGYSYEKSGSLFRPIFIHSFFNAASIIAVLTQ
jgi:membrane protease YdiL (CAAX protease family)